MTPFDPIARDSNRTDAFWMPFTPQRQYRQRPISIASASGMSYFTEDGCELLDTMAGLWCVNAGHAQPKIVEAIRDMAGRLDYVSSFKMSHPGAEATAQALTNLAPASIDHAFFTGSGSEAVETALKIARGYHQARGDGRRTKLIGRQKSYHGVNFGGLSVSGIAPHKRAFGPLLGDVAHLPLPYDERMRFSIGQPECGAEYADWLERLIAIHDASTIAAVIVEPITGSGGIYLPPVGYLEKLREICDRSGILLIFDEVITGFGRLGEYFASQYFGVTPDIITCAKGLTNGAVPMGAVLVRDTVFDAFMHGPAETIELFHGYTYSAHPLACAAALATFAVHQELRINDHVREIAPIWRNAVHALKDAPHVADIRTAGILSAIELTPRPDAPGARAADCLDLCLAAGLLVRTSGDTFLLSPPLIIAEPAIGRIIDTLSAALSEVA
ncbi:aminotransferase class III-fold pyridoxal phosphate-dependent enzyme [Sphingosinicella sp.]|uniref:aminotransferase class III-fold pyridoxal phosphate-dependent enzyme n=1 Tax=Sphingosinicella sp. TaxID=1917971 RepID=UPI0035AE34D2